MSDQLWVMAGVILGAVLGGGAQMVADLLRAGRDSTVRRERLRREAYVDFVAAIEHARYMRMGPLGLSVLAERQLPPATSNELRAELRAWTDDLLRDARELDVVVARVTFVGPANVADKATEIERYISKTRNLSDDEESVEELRQRTAEFVKMAQPYAGVPVR